MNDQTHLLDQKSIFDLLIASSNCFNESMKEVRKDYDNYEIERLDYIDIVEPVKNLVTEFEKGNEEPVRNLFKTIERNFQNCDQNASNFIQSGILETLQNATSTAGLDLRTCYKMLMNQNVLRIWNRVLQG
ncbi:hypothetical protein K6119_11225 [Paracrocinitomix mangrovi]|uniref:DUF7674 family protein n=1 Tax=Paracrocinitomix mangrovi TaxID=2862509 RepID=UPI001EDC672D|nr:hypothetical protein [Paracrocinitomix mangrovi]UKN00305.1 hypothetical protein K6119_11225 [Paracrocinitomix mangrovi]